MFCGAELAWARIAVPACCRIWVLVKLTISDATSRSLMRDMEALRFSDATEMLAVVCSRRFWTAPRLPRTWHARRQFDIAMDIGVGRFCYWIAAVNAQGSSAMVLGRGWQ